MSYVAIWFESEAAAAAAAAELRNYAYEVSPDEDNNPARGLRVAYDSLDAVTDGPDVKLGADCDRVEALAGRFGGEIDTWTVSRLDGFSVRRRGQRDFGLPPR